MLNIYVFAHFSFVHIFKFIYFFLSFEINATHRLLKYSNVYDLVPNRNLLSSIDMLLWDKDKFSYIMQIFGLYDENNEKYNQALINVLSVLGLAILPYIILILKFMFRILKPLLKFLKNIILYINEVNELIELKRLDKIKNKISDENANDEKIRTSQKAEKKTLTIVSLIEPECVGDDCLIDEKPEISSINDKIESDNDGVEILDKKIVVKKHKSEEHTKVVKNALVKNLF